MRAVTLVEILVSISILSLLTAILLPSLGKARQQTLRIVCLANMRALTRGICEYAQDNMDWLPPSAQYYDGKDHFDLSANIVRIESVGYDLASLLGPYVGPDALSCPEPNPKAVTHPDNFAEVVQSNYIFLWGASRSTPVEGVRRLTGGGENALVLADFTWYNVDPEANWTPIWGGNHARPGSPRGAVWEVDLAANPSATQFVQRDTPVHLLGLNAARLSGSVEWYPRKRGKWRTAGPYNQQTAKYSAVYLPRK